MNGRYARHADRARPAEELPQSPPRRRLDDQVEAIRIEATRERESRLPEERTGRHSLPPREPAPPQPSMAQLMAAVQQALDAREPIPKAEARSLQPYWKQLVAPAVVCAALASSVYAVVLVVNKAQDYVKDQVTEKLVPMRREQTEQGVTVRRMSRQMDRLVKALNVPPDPNEPGDDAGTEPTP